MSKPLPIEYLFDEWDEGDTAERGLLLILGLPLITVCWLVMMPFWCVGRLGELVVSLVRKERHTYD